MNEDPEPKLGVLGAWLGEILASHESELQRRGLVLRFEFDPEFRVWQNPTLAHAIRELIRLILATVPDACEIYLGGSRPTTLLSPVGAGRISARWQVMGEAPGSSASASIERLHPRPGDAEQHARSPIAERVFDRFADTDWEFSLEVLGSGSELLASAVLD
jgi:hypothetical protein